MNTPKLGQLWGLGYGPDDPNTWYYHVIHVDDKFVKFQFISTAENGVYHVHYPGEIVEHPIEYIVKFYKEHIYQWYAINGT